MRILFLSHYFPPEVNAPASRTHEMCKRWVRQGHEVTVLTCAPNAPAGKLFPGYRNRCTRTETIDGIRVVRVWTFLAANKGIVFRMLNYISYMISATLRALFLARPDEVVATSPQLFCGWAGYFVKLMNRRPLTLEIRDMFTESITAVVGVQEGMLTRLLRWMEFALYRRADTIVTVGEGYRRRLIEQGLKRDVLIITNGVDRELYSPRPQDVALRAKWNLIGKFVCSYVGTIGMAHGLEIVLDAAQRLQELERDDIVFLLVGDGASRMELESAARRRQLTNVRFAGMQPKDRIPHIYSISDCSLVHLRRAPLFTTVLPSKIFETAHMKRPIILGVEGDAARLVSEAGCGICIEPENAQQLVEALLRLAADPDLQQQLGEAGHAYVARHFDRDHLATRYIAEAFRRAA